MSEELTDSIDYLAESKKYYLSELAKRIKGPQLEGLDAAWLDDALSDPNTKSIELGDGHHWPVFIPLEHNKDYRAGFFEDHYPGRPAYYFSTPPEAGLNGEALLEKISELKEERAVLAYDYLVTKESSEVPLALRGFDFVHDVTPESSAYDQSYGLPKVTHFKAVAKPNEAWPVGDGNISAAFNRLVARGESIAVPDDGPTVLSAVVLRESPNLLNDIWAMYEGQFSELVEDHPSLQIQPREELEQMLLDDEAFNLAYMQDGQITALCYFVKNIDKCVWLNGAFFKELEKERPDVRLAYFPGIVVDSSKARQDGGYVGEMIQLLERVCEESGIGGLQIVFQCTNVSETYIPKIVTDEITKDKTISFDMSADATGSSFQKTAQYNYRVFSFGDA